MNVTVFGGSGFLGSHVADVLTAMGHNVVIYDKVVSPYLLKKQEMIVGDILDEKAVREAVRGAEIIYNFVALSDIDEAQNRPIETARVNVLGNINVLEAAKEEKVKRFVFSSSVYVYSDSGSFYRSSKQSSELFIENYQKLYGLKYTILRYGSLYGPRADERNWIYRVLRQALTEKRMIREGDGEELREYIHVLDAAQLSVDILKPEYENRRVMITGHERIKIKDLLVMVKEMLKGDVDIQYLPAKEGDHYEITPYVFNPQVATKLHGNEHLDMGQGLLNIMAEIHQKHLASHQHKSLKK